MRSLDGEAALRWLDAPHLGCLLTVVLLSALASDLMVLMAYRGFWELADNDDDVR